MPKMQTTVNGLNAAFSPPSAPVPAPNAAEFAPGQPLHKALAKHGAEPGTVLHRAFEAHLEKLPGAIRETIRAVIVHARSTEPPTHVTFAWAPAYDHEVTVWHAPDTADTKGGITVLIKSRYPDDAHPLSNAG